MRTPSRRLLGGIAAAVAATALMIPGTAFAQGGPPEGHGGGPPAGHGHGGGGGESETGNNLSVPTIMVGGEIVSGMGCGTPTDPSTLETPIGNPKDGYPLDPALYYYVQGVNTWQAQCYNDTSALVYGAWGDNLTGTAKLSVGKPIRVELGLMNTGAASVASMQGYDVVKLDPNALDRESAYGTEAKQATDGTFSATPTDYTPGAWRVYDAGVTFSIQNLGTGAYVVATDTPATAEINATGNVVYGYNLRVPAAGTYRITFTTSNTVTFTGSDAGTQGDVTRNTAYIDIVVPSGTGGGGGGHGRP